MVLQTLIDEIRTLGQSGRKAHDYLAVRLGQHRTVVEGFYGGEWLTSEVESWYVDIPEDALQLTNMHPKYLPRIRSGQMEANEVLSLVGSVEEGIYRPADIVPHGGSLYSLKAHFSPRTLVVDDGRVFHQRDLLTAENEFNRNLLPNFLKWIEDSKGFDAVFERYRS